MAALQQHLPSNNEKVPKDAMKCTVKWQDKTQDKRNATAHLEPHKSIFDTVSLTPSNGPRHVVFARTWRRSPWCMYFAQDLITKKNVIFILVDRHLTGHASHRIACMPSQVKISSFWQMDIFRRALYICREFDGWMGSFWKNMSICSDFALVALPVARSHRTHAFP